MIMNINLTLKMEGKLLATGWHMGEFLCCAATLSEKTGKKQR
jgi:hypothetical protein